MIPEKLLEIMKHEGVVAIVTQGENGPHLVNTWNTYLQVTPRDSLLIPAGFMEQTEANIVNNEDVLLSLGAREVEGRNGQGTGFLVEGKAEFHKAGPEYDKVKSKFPWARAALEVHVDSATQTL